MKTVLSIAGSDCSGGAGIQADLKTFSAHKVYGMAVISSVTAQNTLGVSDVFNLPALIVEEQLESVFSDIFPDAVKIGMLGNTEIVKAVARMLKKYQPSNVVADTVMISTSGKRLLEEEAVSVLENSVFPLATLITPNIPEAEYISGCKISSGDDMKSVAKRISGTYNTAVLLKGGHFSDNADDVLCTVDGNITVFRSERIDNPNNHGTGCTLSSAIASNLAVGSGLEQAVSDAKQYLIRALKSGLDLGHGNGPLNHFV